MASACVKTAAPTPDSAFLDFVPACPAYGWLSPRISFSRDLAVEDADPAATVSSVAASVSGVPDLATEFEFRPEDPVAMLPADELFSEGKLVPRQIAAVRVPLVEPVEEIRSPDAERPPRVAEVLGSELCVQSPKAPKCSSRWREILGLKKQQSQKPESQKATAPIYKSLNLSTKSLRHLLHRHSKPSSADSSIGIPLLRDTDSEPACISARRSLSSSSSSSGADHDEFPRLSLDAEKPAQGRISLVRAPPRVRLSRPRGATVESHQAARTGRSPARRGAEVAPPPRGVSVDSPRMNASGKVVFQGLERSSSSPGSFHGAGACGLHHHQRGKPYRAMERSYSVNVRVAPVLNVVPVGSLRVCSSKPGSVFGLGQLFSPHKKDKDVSTARWNLHGGSSRSKIIDKDKA
ncbi:hypothetical protein Cni_G24123 [Canna indica]|uniref:Uncharacterized protein n=1 Tax=Canna indica TaxID=4628 RepID=A0AAQ3KUD8_9LILI|nr:hypothetical protein Cni_G24123 [Canna indica]